jgi:deoxyribodipyrimidine photo-lyase
MEKIGLVFIFREFRINDNTTLLKALKENDKVIVLFTFNPKQTTKDNKYFSHVAFDFLKSALVFFNYTIGKKLSIFEGEPHKILTYIIKKIKIVNIYITRDFTPFSRLRADKILSICNKNNISFHQVEDHVLFFPEYGYKKYTPFLNKAAKHKVNTPVKFNKLDLKKILKIKSNTTLLNNVKLINHREEILNRLKLNYTKYKILRDIPSVDGTTKLSKYLKFGIISIREAYQLVNKDLRRQLYWRDFYYQVAWYFPYVLGGIIDQDQDHDSNDENDEEEYNKDKNQAEDKYSRENILNYPIISHIEENQPLQLKYSSIKWISIDTTLGKTLWKAWTTGTTGFAMVDAGMRQLITTGWMHNRLRMVTASFLVKILLIDWREGEKFFAKHLVDYDPCQNNGGWQWCAGTGADAQPYFRIFNPTSQLISHDPDCLYIKKYCPELKDKTVNEIINQPTIISYSKQKSKALNLYKSV